MRRDLVRVELQLDRMVCGFAESGGFHVAPADPEGIRELSARLPSQPSETQRAYEAARREHEGVTFLLRKGGVVIGGAWFVAGPMRLHVYGLVSELEEAGFVNAVGATVLPEHRGRGAGCALLEQGLLYFRERGERRAVGLILNSNQASLRMVEKLGFRAVRLVRCRRILGRWLKPRPVALADTRPSAAAAGVGGFAGGSRERCISSHHS